MRLYFFRRRPPAPPPPEVYRQVWHKEPEWEGRTDVFSSGHIIDYVQWKLSGFSDITHITRHRFPWNDFIDFDDFKAQQTGYKKIR